MTTENPKEIVNNILGQTPTEVEDLPIESDTDPCDQSPISATEACNMLATIEGNGSYTQDGPSWSSAKGRYQFVKGTAVDQIMKTQNVSSKDEAELLWDKCSQSSSPECKKLQDELCANYSKEIENSLARKGHALTSTNRYLAWNQGAGGANVILTSASTGQPVTNPDILKNMQNQAWAFSSDGATYISNMQGYMAKKGVNLI